MVSTPTVYVICDQNCKFEGMTKEQILTAIMQAVNEGTIGDINAGFVTTIKTITGTPLKFFVGEKSEYDKLTAEEKENLFAIITNDTTKAVLLNEIADLKRTAQALEEWTIDISEGDIIVPKAKEANHATTAETADHATRAETAARATRAETAARATTAETADTAGSAGYANSAITAETANSLNINSQAFDEISASGVSLPWLKDWRTYIVAAHFGDTAINETMILYIARWEGGGYVHYSTPSLNGNRCLAVYNNPWTFKFIDKDENGIKAKKVSIREI